MPDPLITVAELGNYLGRDLSTDAAGTAVVKGASDICRDVAEQTFNHGTTTDTFDGSGTDALLLPEVPVSSVGPVEVLELDGTLNTWGTVGSADYTVNGDGILYSTNRAGTALGVWPRGRQNVRVTYGHGYSDADMPESVKAVAKSVASRLLIQGPAIFENLGDLNIRYAAESTALMPTERAILRKHKRTK